MKNFLQEILAAKRDEVTSRQAEVPLAKLVDRCHDQAAPRGFATALANGSEIAVVAEIKKASPSAGVLREEFEPEVVARAFSDHGARAVSVVTEAHFFQGSTESLSRVHEVVELPLLCKDFLIDPYQLYEARAHGADAVLLIVAAVEPEQLAELQRLASELEMDSLIEVHNERELEIATKLGAELVGINNRDLLTFEVDPTTAARLAGQVAEGVTVVAESGIQTRADVEALAGTGVDAVLVGEVLMRSRDPGMAVEQLIGVPK